MPAGKRKRKRTKEEQEDSTQTSTQSSSPDGESPSEMFTRAKVQAKGLKGESDKVERSFDVIMKVLSQRMDRQQKEIDRQQKRLRN